MQPDRWTQIAELFSDLLTVEPARRTERLRETCAGDPELEAELVSLLSAHDAAGPLDRPADDLRLFASGDEISAASLGMREGDRVGPYRLLRSLGEGGMGSVWLAARTDGLLTRSVALKLPHWSWILPDLAERMAREREILAALEHPNIARLYDAGVDRLGRPYLALEYVEGEPIDRFCARRKLSIPQTLELVLQVARAVGYAHSRLVVHRDLKPSNVLVSSDGSARLLDFGIAKLLEENAAPATRLTGVIGRAMTPDYASPEQLKGEPVTTASDVYSLGVMIYELLSGSHPYQLNRASAAQWAAALASTDPRRLSEAACDEQRKRQLRGDLDAILSHALKKNPRERYGTVAELADDLERYLRGEPVRAQADSVWYRGKKFVGRNKLAVTAATAVALALTVGLAVALWQGWRAQHEATRAMEANLRLLTQTAADRLKEADVSGAQAIILEVLADREANPADSMAAISVFQEARAAASELAILVGHTDWVLSAAYSYDGAHIVTASIDKTARIWDANTGAQLAQLEGHGGSVNSAHYSPDSTRIVTASNDKTARIWDARNGTPLAVLSGHGDWVLSANYSPDGTRIVTASADKTARIWDARTGTALAVLMGHGESVHFAAYSPDGARIVTASADKTARIWDARSGRQMTVLNGHADAVQAAAYSPDGTRIVTASDDNTARIWDARTGVSLAVIAGHGSRLYSAAYSPDGANIVTTSDDGTARIWDGRTGAQLAVMAGHNRADHGDSVYCAAYSPDGSRVVTAADDLTARIWDAHTGATLAVLVGHGDFVQSAAYSPDGSRIVTGSVDKTARIWDARSGAPLAVLTGSADVVQWGAYSPDGTRIITASDDRTARIWDARTNGIVAVLVGHGGRIFSAAYSPDGSRVVTASYDHTASIWDARTGRQMLVLAGHGGSVQSANYSPDGKRIVTASGDRTARIWDAHTGDRLAVLAGHTDAVQWATYSPDGAQIATASDDKSVRIWDASTGAQLQALVGHTARVYFVAYSPDGQRIVTASNDKTARIWDVRTGAQLAVLAGHGAVVNTSAYSPDGQRIVTASDDKTARIWDAQVAGSLRAQIQWSHAALFDTLPDFERAQMGLEPDARIRKWSPASECDRLSAAPYDPDRRAPGIETASITADLAQFACSGEIRKSADTPRLVYQLGRAMWARRDTQGARSQFARAIALGYRAARIDLADLLVDDTSAMRNPRRALSLYEQAWESGVPLAAYKLGHIYELGTRDFKSATNDVSADAAKSWVWYQRGAEAGEPRSLARLAERDEHAAMAETITPNRDALLLSAFRFYAAAADHAGVESWPDDAWKKWRYRRATLARLLAKDGILEQVADAYAGVRDSTTRRPPTWLEKLQARLR